MVLDKAQIMSIILVWADTRADIHISAYTQYHAEEREL